VKTRRRSIRIISQYHIESNRTIIIALFKHKSRILGAQTPAHGDLPNVRRHATRRSVDDVTIPRLHHRRWVWRARAWSRLVVVRRLASNSAGIDVVSSECEAAATDECECAGRLSEAGEVEDEVADLALYGVGIELEVEDGADVVWGYGCPFGGWIGLIWVLRADGDEK